MDTTKKIDTIMSIYSPSIKIQYTPNVTRALRTPGRAKSFLWNPGTKPGDVLASCYYDENPGAQDLATYRKVVNASWQIKQHVDDKLGGALSDYEKACTIKLNEYLSSHPQCTTEDLDKLAAEYTAGLEKAKAVLSNSDFRELLVEMAEKNLI